MKKRVTIARMDAGPNIAIFWDSKGHRFVDVLYQDDYKVGDTVDIECNRHGTVESIEISDIPELNKLKLGGINI